MTSSKLGPLTVFPGVMQIVYRLVLALNVKARCLCAERKGNKTYFLQFPEVRRMAMCLVVHIPLVGQIRVILVNALTKLESK
jgi:hypothetical protein